LLITGVLTVVCRIAGLYIGQAGIPTSDQDLLVRYIFEDKQYNSLALPVISNNDTVLVKVGLAMIQIVQLDEKYQRLKSNVWLRMSWHDYRLAWDPSEFAGIQSINIAAHKLWKPDIVVLNNVDGEFEARWKPNMILHSNGDVLWIPPAIFKTSCAIDVRFFPFDQQTCHMDLGSWTYTNNQVEIKFYNNQTTIDLSDYVANGGWDFLEGPGYLHFHAPPRYEDLQLTHNVRYGRASNRPISARVTFKIVLRRKPLFYITNLIIPCILIVLLSVCVFYLPTNAGEKITLSISILVTLVVYMILVSKILPSGPKTIPLLSQFLLFTFAMTFLALCITAGVIINLYHRNPKNHPTMSRWVFRMFIEWLPVVLCLQRTTKAPRTRTNSTMGRFGKIDTTSTADNTEDELSESAFFPCGPETSRNNHPNAFENVLVMQNLWEEGCKEKKSTSCVGRTKPIPIEATPISIGRSLETIIKSVDRIVRRVAAEERERQVSEDWKYVASIIDRVQLIIFICAIAGGTLTILMNAPYIFSEVDQQSIIKKFSYKDRN
uniref:Neur_chan_LBD domain-containing protein n=1 Tax=Mesocestoides corti TaxID=53468 RepID=A0A5K3EM91_MESCO